MMNREELIRSTAYSGLRMLALLAKENSLKVGDMTAVIEAMRRTDSDVQAKLSEVGKDE